MLKALTLSICGLGVTMLAYCPQTRDSSAIVAELPLPAESATSEAVNIEVASVSQPRTSLLKPAAREDEEGREGAAVVDSARPGPGGEWIVFEPVPVRENLEVSKATAYPSFLNEFASFKPRDLALEISKIATEYQKRRWDTCMKLAVMERGSMLSPEVDAKNYVMPPEFEGSIIKIFDRGNAGHLVVRVPYSEDPFLYEAKWRLEAAQEIAKLNLDEARARRARRSK